MTYKISRVGKKFKGTAQELFRLGENDEVGDGGRDVGGTDGYGSSVQRGGAVEQQGQCWDTAKG